MNIYEAFIPAWSNTLSCLKNILGKAQSHADAQSYDSGVLINNRLFPDMFPLVKQVQIACDMVARGAARLSQAELPEFADDEVSIADLQDRIDSTLSYLSGLNANDFADAADREVEVPVGGGNTMKMSGGQYVQGFVIPNLYFHTTTTYNLLRSNGVPLGKRDFLVAG